MVTSPVALQGPLLTWQAPVPPPVVYMDSPCVVDQNRPEADVVQELELFKARTTAAEMTLADLEQDVSALRLECQRGREQQEHMAKALQESIPLGEHYQTLRKLSQDHQAASSKWEQRQNAAEP